MMILALITQLAKYECTIYSADGQSPMESAFEPGLSADDESMCVSDASVAMELLNECAESSHLIERKARPALLTKVLNQKIRHLHLIDGC